MLRPTDKWTRILLHIPGVGVIKKTDPLIRLSESTVDILIKLGYAIKSDSEIISPIQTISISAPDKTDITSEEVLGKDSTPEEDTTPTTKTKKVMTK